MTKLVLALCIFGVFATACGAAGSPAGTRLQTATIGGTAILAILGLLLLFRSFGLVA